jgi:hypothetical protein
LMIMATVSSCSAAELHITTQGEIL